MLFLPNCNLQIGEIVAEWIVGVVASHAHYEVCEMFRRASEVFKVGSDFLVGAVSINQAGANQEKQYNMLHFRTKSLKGSRQSIIFHMIMNILLSLLLIFCKQEFNYSSQSLPYSKIRTSLFEIERGERGQATSCIRNLVYYKV